MLVRANDPLSCGPANFTNTGTTSAGAGIEAISSRNRPAA
jgi:hypothetical protein